MSDFLCLPYVFKVVCIVKCIKALFLVLTPPYNHTTFYLYIHHCTHLGCICLLAILKSGSVHICIHTLIRHALIPLELNIYP